ncbi:hypothetical protein G1K53_11640, partial [Tenacibaculum finnmarkense]|uniref:RHS repeat-associated core domain-containing protein n=3 Tax=Tenacibaculum finnmarkense TaxID=2781243 RepID=UPI0027385F06
KLDRPVLTQDANLNEQKKWLFTKYDILGRVAYTGYIDNESSQSVLQEAANHPTTYTQWEKREPKQTYGGTDIYYSKTAVPHGVTKVYTINYYDTYVDLPTSFTAPTTVYNQVITTNTKGLSTVNKTRVLGTDKWITTISHYDEKARPIYVYSKNDYLGTVDISETKLNDFTGILLENRTTHIKSGKTIVTIDSFTYDHMNRLLSQKQCIGDETLTGCGDEANSTDIVLSKKMILNTSKTIVDNNSITFKDEFHVKAIVGKSASFSISEDNAELITSNTYDDLGQLISKKVGNKEASPLQTVDYKYNVRGWLKDINDDEVADNDLFNFSLKYNDPTNGAALFNGNISQTSWNTLSQDKSIKTYTYDYDALNRIKSGTGVLGSKYDVSGISYDKNGNIKTLLRKGHINIDADVFGTMDNLVYSYDSGNKLHAVTDTGAAPIGVKGQFQDKNTSGNDYTYDVNGNMISDANKGITNITYNHLNLPTRVTIDGKYINYVYDATGVKLSKYIDLGYSENEYTYYAGNYIYKRRASRGAQPKLEFFNHPEGYVSPVNANDISQGFKYVYQYKDHLGNVRLSYTDNNNDGVITPSTEIIEESNYYPFGLKHKGYNNTVSSLGNSTAQKFGFEGVELEESLGYNMNEMDWRHYDSTLGRFNVIDPMAEERNWLNPYNFVQNNPILRVDPTGLLDDYGIDKSGNIELIKKTDDKTDTLYAVNKNENGEKVVDESKGSVTVDKNKDGSSVVSDLANNKVSSKYLDADDLERTVSETIAVAGESSKDDVFKVFKFAADNSNVEWSVNKLGVNGSNRYQIGTNFSSNYSPGFKRVGKWLGMIHSHPNQSTANDRKESLYGDLSVGVSYLSKYGKKSPYLVYFPSTGNTAKMRVGKTATGKTAAKKPIRGLKKIKF